MKVSIHSIRENPHNPRTITEEKFRKLVESIRQFPEMLEARPIVIDQSKTILGGNMRWKAAKEAGLQEVPVYMARWDEEKNPQFIIKDNVGFGEWDWDMLANEWDAVDLQDWGLDVWSVDKEESDEITEDTYNFGEQWFLSVELDDEKQTQEWYQKLMEAGLKVKIVQ